MSKHSLDWFLERKGKEVIRVTPEFESTVETVDGPVISVLFFNLQEKGYIFEEVITK